MENNLSGNSEKAASIISRGRHPRLLTNVRGLLHRVFSYAFSPSAREKETQAARRQSITYTFAVTYHFIFLILHKSRRSPRQIARQSCLRKHTEKMERNPPFSSCRTEPQRKRTGNKSPVRKNAGNYANWRRFSSGVSFDLS